MAAPGYPAYGTTQGYPPAVNAPNQHAPPSAAAPASVPRSMPAVSVPTTRTSGSVQTADASLETVGRALGDLRQANATANGAAKLKVPTTDFDFETANARFDKTALAPQTVASPDIDSDQQNEQQSQDRAYDPQRSFFDALTSGTGGGGGNGGRGGRGGKGRGGGRNRREEERERNVATFGEPGGVGLMGPGAYVGGWGGSGRRGGGRGRRGLTSGTR
jgi:protein LSM14